MHCASCGTIMWYLGTDHEGKQHFDCHQDGCPRRHLLTRRWWESGTDFHVEEMPAHSPGGGLSPTG
jgi:hypothetical protein